MNECICESSCHPSLLFLIIYLLYSSNPTVNWRLYRKKKKQHLSLRDLCVHYTIGTFCIQILIVFLLCTIWGFLGSVLLDDYTYISKINKRQEKKINRSNKKKVVTVSQAKKNHKQYVVLLISNWPICYFSLGFGPHSNEMR